MLGEQQRDYRLGYRGDLEGLRGVAILLVVAAHAGVPWLSGGFIGVDVFFVLSGFLITGLLLHEIDATGRVNFSEFYVRRLRRLLPALLLMLVVVAWLATMLLTPAEQLRQAPSAAMASVWMSNIHFALAQLDYFAPDADTNLFLHTWSLGVEEQFYLVWPALLVWLLARDGARGVARVKLGMLLIAGVSLVLCIASTWLVPRLAFYMMPLRAWQFAAGALVWLYLMRRGSVRVNPTTRLVGGWLALLLIVAVGVGFRPTMGYPGLWAVLPTIGAMGVIAAGCGGLPSTGVSQVLAWRPLQWLGHVSYAWYLWHWPILLLGRAVTGTNAPAGRFAWLLLSLIVAVASYRLVESPVRHQRAWLARPRRVVFGALVVMVLANLACLNWFSHASDRVVSPEFRRYAAAHFDAPQIYAMGCDDWFHGDQVRFCSFGPTNAAYTVVLMGDSHAGQWTPAFREAFAGGEWRLLVVTKSSCPMVDQPYFYARIGREYTECARWRTRALDEISVLRPDLVVLASSTAGFDKSQWFAGTSKILDRLTAASDDVVFLRDTPALPFDGPDCLAKQHGRADWMNRRSECSAPATPDDADDVFQWTKMLADTRSNVRVVDLNELVCPDHRCSAEQSGLIVFRDSQHLTRRFAASLGREVRQRLDKAISAGVHASAVRRGDTHAE